jgi:hypothetical protein
MKSIYDDVSNDAYDGYVGVLNKQNFLQQDV